MTLWGCLVSLWAACAFAATRAVVPAMPLAQLAPILSAALPAPAVGQPSSAGLLPASLDLARAQVLAVRAGVSAAPTAAAAAPVARATPARAIEAVNAVLKDVAPERLAAMPNEDLNAVGGLILDAMNGAAPRADAAAVKVLAEASAQRLAPLVGRPTLERSTYKPGDDRHEEQFSVAGLPEGAKWVTATAGTVYRHYTTQEGVSQILAGRSLLNGFVSYVQRSAGLWHKTFLDATGLFLTKPTVSGERVGVPAKEYPYYVDVTLPAGIPLLQLEDGILMIPLPARTRGWMADFYRRWAAGEEIPAIYKSAVLELNARGGPGPALAVPVRIVGSGRAQ